MNPTHSQTPGVVLVPGAFAGTWMWDDVAECLISHTPALHVIDPQARLRKLYTTQQNYTDQSDQLGSLLPGGLAGTPTTVFINRQGEVVHIQSGEYVSQGAGLRHQALRPRVGLKTPWAGSRLTAEPLPGASRPI